MIHGKEHVIVSAHGLLSKGTVDPRPSNLVVLACVTSICALTVSLGVQNRVTAFFILASVGLLAALPKRRALLLDPWLSVFCAVILASIFWSVAPADVPAQVIIDGGAVVIGTLLASHMSLVSFRRVLEVTLFVLGAISLFGVLSHMPFALDARITGGYGEAKGVFAQKNHWAMYMALGLGLSLFAPVATAGSKLFRFVCIGTFGLSLVMAQSAGGILLAAMFGVFRVAWAGYRLCGSQVRSVLVFYSVIFALASCLLIPLMGPVIFEMLGRDTSLHGRTDIWHTAVEFWFSKPWAGFGWGTWRFSDVIMTTMFARFDPYATFHAHNGFLMVAVELGLFGLIPFSFGMITAAGRAVRVVVSYPTADTVWIMSFMSVYVIANVQEYWSRGLLLTVVTFVAIELRWLSARVSLRQAGS